MGRAHGGGVADHGEVSVKGRDGDFKRRAGLGRENIIALAVNYHVVILAAAPDDSRDSLAIGDCQRDRRVDMGFTRTAGEGDLRGIRAVGQTEIGNGFARVFHRDGFETETL